MSEKLITESIKSPVKTKKKEATTQKKETPIKKLRLRRLLCICRKNSYTVMI